MKDFFEIGKIVNVHGVQGEVKLKPCTKDVGIFSSLDFLLIEGEKFFIESVRIHKKMALIKFKGINSREDSSSIMNKFVAVSRDMANKLEEGEYYIADLLDCSVYENDILLGKIIDIIETGSNDVYHVKNKDNEILIPALKTVVMKIDIIEKRIEVILPKGLVDDNV